jgi:short-subunit dehydrogenase
MKENGGGSIVNVGSMWAKQAISNPFFGLFNAKKAGLHSFTQHLAGISRLQYSCECRLPQVITYITAFFAEKKKPKST